jgi:hypothetical protein
VCKLLNIRDPVNPVYLGGYDTFPGAVSGFDGNWGVYPFLGLDRVLASDLDGGLYVLDATAAAAPEPSSLILCGISAGGALLYGARRRLHGRRATVIQRAGMAGT